MSSSAYTAGGGGGVIWGKTKVVFPRPAATRDRECDHGGFRPREQRTGGGLPALAQRRGAGQDAGYFRAGSERVPRAAEDGQGGGGPLSWPAATLPIFSGAWNPFGPS